VYVDLNQICKSGAYQGLKLNHLFYVAVRNFVRRNAQDLKSQERWFSGTVMMHGVVMTGGMLRDRNLD
jgi:hypothetical protein